MISLDFTLIDISTDTTSLWVVACSHVGQPYSVEDFLMHAQRFFMAVRGLHANEAASHIVTSSRLLKFVLLSVGSD